jgi:hypothetical protein
MSSGPFFKTTAFFYQYRAQIGFGVHPASYSNLYRTFFFPFGNAAKE